MRPVRIIPPQGGGLGFGTRVETEDGVAIPLVTRITVTLAPDERITAEMEVAVNLAEVTAHPLLGLDTVREAAAAHGYELVKRD